MTEQGNSETICGCKLGRVASEYGLAVDETLRTRWTEGRESTRALADWFNTHLLETALVDAGLSPRDGEVANIYRLLTEETVTSGTRLETRADLEREGIPVEEVESDFLSHQTVYNHLTNCLDASLSDPTDEQRRQDAASTLAALQNRTEAVTTDTISRLDRQGALSIAEFDVVVSVTVTCNECHRQYTVRELLDETVCGCFGGHGDE